MKQICPGCGRELETSGEGPLLCAGCLFVQPQAGSAPPRLWRAWVAATGAVLLAAAGITTSLMYGFFTSRLGLGALMAAAILPVSGLPLLLFLLGRRNAHLTQGTLYVLLGAWLWLWSLFPGIDTTSLRALRMVGLAMSAGGVVLLIAFARALSRYKRA
ncbi:MAG: hypothetical protein ACYC55_03655 [Candidatus Geothermincolia bacterium]